MNEDVYLITLLKVYTPFGCFNDQISIRTDYFKGKMTIESFKKLKEQYEKNKETIIAFSKLENS